MFLAAALILLALIFFPADQAVWYLSGPMGMLEAGLWSNIDLVPFVLGVLHVVWN